VPDLIVVRRSPRWSRPPGDFQLAWSGRFYDVFAQFVTSISLREDIFGKALGAITPVGFLYNLKYQFRHMSMIWQQL